MSFPVCMADFLPGAPVVASAAIGFSHYHFLPGSTEPGRTKAGVFRFDPVVLFLLYRRIESIGRISVVRYPVMVTILWIVVKWIYPPAGNKLVAFRHPVFSVQFLGCHRARIHQVCS